MRRFDRNIAGLAILLAALSLSGCERSGGSQQASLAARPNVILISIDSLRPDHLHCYGYARQTSPTLDRLAAEGALFENAISSAPWTLPAHAAMFTGLADSVHGVLDTVNKLPEQRRTLAEVMREAGYQTAGFFSGPYLHPIFGLSQGFETYEDCTSYARYNDETAAAKGMIDEPELWDRMHADITNPHVLSAVSQWADTRTRMPFFLFVHMWDVHFDFIPPPPYDTMFDPDYTGPMDGRNFFFDPRVNKEMPARDLEHLKALYDGEIAWTDATLEKILTKLREKGLLKDAIVMVTADHGTAFFEHGLKAHRNALYDEVIRIPLILWAPGRAPAGLRVSRQVRTIDLAPTLIELAGLQPPAMMGQSLAPLLRGGILGAEGPALSELFSRDVQARAYRRPERKLIHYEGTDGALVFDLARDPKEMSPIADAGSPVLKALLEDRAEVRRWLEQGRAAFPGKADEAELDETTLQALRAHGYVGGASSERAASKPGREP